MKMRLTFLMLSALTLMVSCQKNEFDDFLRDGVSKDGVIESFTTSAQITETKMSIEEAAGKVKKTWAVGDSLVGFSNSTYSTGKYGYFTFKCTAVNEGTATWKRDEGSSRGGYPQVGETLHLAYAPGIKASTLNDQAYTGTTLFATQTDGSIPAIMCGSGKVDAEGSERLAFTNQMALLSLSNFALEGVTKATTIKSISISGVYTNATLGLKDDKICITPTETSTGTVTISNEDGWTTDADGFLSDRIFVALLPGTNAKDLVVKATTDNWSYIYTVTADKTIEANNYLRIKGSGKESAKVFAASPAEAQVTAGGTTTRYGLFKDALADADNYKGEATITLLSDCSTEDVASPITNTDGITLDLNSHNLLSTASSLPDYTESTGLDRLIVNGGKLTIKGEGSVYQAETKNTHLIVVTSGDLIIESGTFTSSKSAAVYAYISDSNHITIKGGTFSGNSSASGTIAILKGNLNIEGTPTATSTSGKALYAATDGTVNISGNPAFSSSTGYALHAASSSTVNISGGTFESGASYTLYLDSTSEESTISGGKFINTNDGKSILAYIIKGKCTITGGTFKSSGSNSYVLRTDKSSVTEESVTTNYYGKADITGGDFIAGGKGFYTGYGSAKVSVSGGCFYTAGSPRPFITASSENSIKAFTVTGGNFNNPTISSVKYTTPAEHSCDSLRNSTIKTKYFIFNRASDTTITINGESYTFGYRVKKITGSSNKAAINETEYSTFKAAFNNAVNGDVIRLLDTNTLASSATLKEKILTVDLNGHVLYENGTYRVNADSLSTLIIEDCSSNGFIIQKSTGSNTIKVNKGKLIINRGSVYSSASSATILISNQGECKVNGGAVVNANTDAESNYAFSLTYSSSKLYTSDDVKVPIVYGNINKGKDAATLSIAAGYYSIEPTPDTGFKVIESSSTFKVPNKEDALTCNYQVVAE